MTLCDLFNRNVLTTERILAGDCIPVSPWENMASETSLSEKVRFVYIVANMGLFRIIEIWSNSFLLIRFWRMELCVNVFSI